MEESYEEEGEIETEEAKKKYSHEQNRKKEKKKGEKRTSRNRKKETWFAFYNIYNQVNFLF